MRLLLALGIVAGCAQAPAGPAPVGFRVITQVDSSRRTPAFPEGRPLQLGVWYPASETGAAGSEMRYGIYVGLQGGETAWPGDSAATARAMADVSRFLAGAGLSDSAIAAMMAAPMRAVPGLSPRRIAVPVVLLASGNGGTIADVAFLGEALAERGYIAVGMPSPTRLGDTLAAEADLGRIARVQARDLAFALAAVRSDRDLRAGPVAVAGHSLGARGALLLALEDSSVRAVVSLDGGIGSATGQESMRAEIDAIGGRLGAPLLHIYERRDSFMRPDLTLLRSLRPARIATADAGGLGHVHFSSVGDLAAVVSALARITRTDSAFGSDLARTRRTVLWFLDREVRRRGPAVPDSGLAVTPLR